MSNAKALANALLGYGFDLLSGGTDNHMMTIDLRNKGIKSHDAEEMLELAGITVSRCSLPFDPTPEAKNGIRIGTPSVTTRDMSENDMNQIALVISMVIENFGSNKDKAVSIVKELLNRYPLYPELFGSFT